MLAMFKQPLGELFMMEQMSLKKGLKYFGKTGADAMVAEMRQLDYYLDVIKPVDRKDLTHEQKCHALSYLMYLKQNDVGESRQEDVQVAGNNESTKARMKPALQLCLKRLFSLLPFSMLRSANRS